MADSPIISQNIISQNGITITNNSFKIGSKTIYLHSGEMHYFRVQPKDWADRIAKVKEMGLNAICTYVPWNFHEVEKGKFDFQSPEKDLDSFIHLCENKALYIIIRPGPWICAEWQNGGIPQWLLDDHPKVHSLNDKREKSKWTNKKAPSISYLSPTYLKYIEIYYKEVGSIISKHLYPHGGVILLQPDNELTFSFNKGLYEVDYNPIMIEYYYNFLKRKYGDVSSINKLYSQSFLGFSNIVPPTEDSFESAQKMLNEYALNGEYIRLLDWMESKEDMIQEFTSQLCLHFRKMGLSVPYFVNMAGHESPTNAIKQQKAYKMGIWVGDDWYFKYFEPFVFGDLRLEVRTEWMKARLNYLPFIPEFEGGQFDQFISPNQTQIMTRLAIGHGIKGINYYMAVGGINPDGMYKGNKFNYSSIDKSIGFDGEKFFMDDTGRSYDFQAPIGQLGQRNPRFEVVKLFSDYLNVNGEKLVSAQKVNDDLAFMWYQPYSRIKFDTKQLGCKIDYRTYLGDDITSQFMIFLRALNIMGIRPSAFDPEIASVDQLLQKKILMMPMFNFMDTQSMKKFKEFVEKGGVIISFVEIPRKNEKLQPDHTLFDLYSAILWENEHTESIMCMGEKFTEFDSVYSYRFIKDLTVQEKMIHDVATNDIPEGINVFAYYEQDKIKKTVGFWKQVGKGKIIHIGFTPSPGEQSAKIIKKILEIANYSGTNTICNKNCCITRQKCSDNEEFITVVNLESEIFRDVSIDLKKAKNLKSGMEEIHLTGIDIPPRTALQWTLNKKLEDSIVIGVCTSEINYIERTTKNSQTEVKIMGYHFKESKNLLDLFTYHKPISILLRDKEIPLSQLNGENEYNISIQELSQSGEFKYHILIRYSGSLSFKVSLDQKGITGKLLSFNLIEKPNFKD
jgi:beta-galactosidase